MAETTVGGTLAERSLLQQGYDHTPTELRELEWGLRFTPLVCMAGAIVGLLLRQPAIHFALAALGILPFWFPAWHPVDRFYNHVLRPLWGGVPLPPNPLPRRIACLMGGLMNVAIGLSFAFWSDLAAYGFGVVLIVLQLVVITTHFCVASWMFEALLLVTGRRRPPVPVERARTIVEDGGRLVDVRTPAEFVAGHLPGAVNLPVDTIDRHLDELAGAPTVLYCRSGMRCRQAADILVRGGLDDVHDLGSLDRWDTDT